MSAVRVAVSATVEPDGSVRCKVSCDGQKAVLVFDGQEVFIEVPEPSQDQA